MLYIENNNIQLTRGDTAYLTVNIINEATNNPYILSEEDILKLTVDFYAGNNKPIISKTADKTGNFIITPEDTKKLNFRQYVYDVQLTTKDGDVFTIIPPSTFEICEEVTE